MNLITKLTPEQKALIPVYINKWQQIAFSTAETNKDKAITAVKQVYSLINKPEPIIVFCDRPALAEDVLFEAGLNNFGFCLEREVLDILISKIEENIKTRLNKKLYNFLRFKILYRECLDEKKFDTWRRVEEDFYGLSAGDIAFLKGQFINNLVINGLVFDFCHFLIGNQINNLDCNWNLLLDLVSNCSQIFWYENICIVYEKLKIFSIDRDGYLHNEAKPAIKFRDGTSFYAYHGNIIPEKYGKIHPSQWKAEWLLQKDEPGLQEVLIDAIGENNISRDLKTTAIINQVGVLTPKQKALVSVYKEKWKQIAFSTERCDRDLVTEYIKRAYKYLGVKETEIIFFSST